MYYYHKRINPEIEAHNVGHDLARGVAYFQKPQRLTPVPTGDTSDELTARWETSPADSEEPAGAAGDVSRLTADATDDEMCSSSVAHATEVDNEQPADGRPAVAFRGGEEEIDEQQVA